MLIRPPASYAVIGLAVMAIILTPRGLEAANTLRDAKAHYERTEYKEAIGIWEQLAHAGSGAAFYNLAQAHHRGHGVRADLPAALGFFAQGGLQGHIESIAGLATLLYFEGLGAGARGDSLTLLRQAGRGGSAEAQYLLSVLHFNGEGVAEDAQLAYAWGSLAAGRGIEAAGEVVRKARASLSEHQIGQADKLKGALEGVVDFQIIEPILTKWSRSAPQLAPRAAAQAGPTPGRAAGILPQASPVANKWRLQVGAFRSIGGAQVQLKKLADSAEGMLKGLQWAVLQTKQPGMDDVFYRLQIGPFPDRASAEAKCEQIKPLDLDCFVVSP